MRTPILLAGTALAACLALGFVSASQEETVDSAAPRIVLGTFDSRALVVAYAHSDRFAESTKELHAAHRQAKETGDAEAIAALEERGQSLQALMHRQTFCAAPIPKILELLEDELPAVAKQAGVDVIVSRWNVTYRNETARSIDVTDLLVEPFDPDERVLKIVEDLKDQAPLPLEALEGHEDH